MDTSWKRSIDVTLQNTRATLRRLQERHAHYDAAKRRVDEAFDTRPLGAATTAGARSTDPLANGSAGGWAVDGGIGRNAGASSGHEAALAGLRTESPNEQRGIGQSSLSGIVPPPLPPSRATVMPSSSVLFSSASRGRQQQPQHGQGGGYSTLYSNSALAATSSLGGSYPAHSVTVKELSDAYRFLDARLRSVTIELELERTVRADGLRELASKQARQMHELTSAVHVLREENSFLKESVRSLQSQCAFGLGASGLREGSGTNRFAGATRNTHGGTGVGVSQLSPSATATMTNLAVGPSTLDDAKSTFLGQSYTAGAGDVASGDERMKLRLLDLEGKIQRQQRLLDDRQGRMDHLLKDLVDAKVLAEVERVRSIAREAAREAADDMLRVRLNAVQSMFHDELHNVLEKTGVTQEVSRSTEVLFRQHERDWSAKWNGMQEALADLQRRVAGATSTSDRLAELERRTSTGLGALELGLNAAQRDIQENHLRLSQSTSAQLESTRVDLLATLHRLAQEQQQQLQRDGLVMREQDVRRLLEGAVTPMESRLETVEDALRKQRENQEAFQRQAGRGTAELQSEVGRWNDTAAELQRRLDAHAVELEKLRVEGSSSQSQGRAAASAAEDAGQAAQEALGLVRRLQERSSEETAKLDAQVRRLTQAQDTSKEKLQSVAAEMEALSGLVGELHGSMRAVESSVPRTVQPLVAKVEALSSLVQQSCMPTLDTVQEGLAAASARVQQMYDARQSRDRQVAQQLSDLRKEVEAQTREAEGRLRRDLDEAQMRSTAQLEMTSKKVAALTKQHQGFSESIVDRVDDLSGRLAKLEADVGTALRDSSQRSPSQPNQQEAQSTSRAAEAGMAAAEEAAKAILADHKNWVVQHLEAAEQRGQDRLVQESQTLRQELSHVKHHFTELSQQRVQDTQVQLKRLEDAAREQAAAVLERVDEADAHTGTRLAAVQERVKEQVTAARLVHNLVGDEAALEQLAGSLQAKLTSSSTETVAALAQMRTALRSVETTQQQLQQALEDKGRELVERSSLDSLATSHSALLERLAAVEETTAQAVQQLRKQAKDAQTSALECHTRLEDVLPSLQRRLSAAEASDQDLLASYAGVGALVQQRVQAAVEAVRTEHEGLLQPVEAKVRRLDEQSGAARSAQEHLLERVDLLSKGDLERQRALDEVIPKLAGVQAQLDMQQKVLLSEHLQPLQDAVARLDQEVRRLQEEGETRSTQPAPPQQQQHEQGAASKVAAEEQNDELARITARLGALEAFAESVEGTGEAGLLATADALAGLRDGLQQCLDRAVDYLRNDRRTVGGTLADDASTGDSATVAVPRLEALDDLFILLLTQLSDIHNALGTLQQNAVATLELIQQQELDVLAIPPLQAAVLQLSEKVKPIAAAVGIDPEDLTVELGSHGMFPPEEP